MNDKFFNSMRSLQTRIYYLYDKGVIAVTEGYVQVTEELFSEIIKDHSGLAFRFLDDPKLENDFEASIVIWGVQYITVAKISKFKALGIPVPERQ